MDVVYVTDSAGRGPAMSHVTDLLSYIQMVSCNSCKVQILQKVQLELCDVSMKTFLRSADQYFWK